jgi:hypothetical protein
MLSFMSNVRSFLSAPFYKKSGMKKMLTKLGAILLVASSLQVGVFGDALACDVADGNRTVPITYTITYSGAIAANFTPTLNYIDANDCTAFYRSNVTIKDTNTGVSITFLSSLTAPAGSPYTYLPGACTCSGSITVSCNVYGGNCYTPFNPTCAALGEVGTYPLCSAPVCPTGDGGTYPNCTCPAGFTGSVGPAPVCSADPVCPTGDGGTYPVCTCPTNYNGTAGPNPVCIRDVCPAGDGGSYPTCTCPSGFSGSSGPAPVCTANPACPAGDGGAYPVCTCPTNYNGTPGPNPVCIPDVCPTGDGGTYPNCTCPAGSTGTPSANPTCTSDTISMCPSGDQGTYPNCTPIPCPAGETGTYPACVVASSSSASCPNGTIGTYPDCTSSICPTGQIGVPPNCTTPACPTGDTGAYPNCVAPTATCPTGDTGTPPNCVMPTTYTCPTGFTGTPPNCTAESVTATGSAQPEDTAFQISEANLTYQACESLAGYQVNPDQIGVTVNGGTESAQPLTVTEAAAVCQPNGGNTVVWTIR